jgi:sigma-B regulation protein RsbU (phosphoserine phosphatase)
MTPTADSPAGRTAPADWQERLELIVETMREMSRQTDPQAMVRAYLARMRRILPSDRMVAVSRRGLPAPKYRITRSSLWKEDVNPWKEPHKLPLLEGGLLGGLLYGDVPRLIEDHAADAADPAFEYLRGMRSLMALPLYDGGSAVNMVVLMREEPAAFDPQRFPEMVWMSGLFGRATTTLVLSDELRAAYETLDQELKIVSDIQLSLLPARLPQIPGVDLAAHYRTSRRAGGDYYDFFQLPEGKWGMLIADVSGHGTPAAVLMAVTHSIAHAFPGVPCSPARLLTHINRHLAARYTADASMFVTAFYGVYDPVGRTLTYSAAGHPAPRVKNCDDGRLIELNSASGLPLGVLDDETFGEAEVELRPGDQMILYTDGVTEAFNPAGEMFGEERLDQTLSVCTLSAAGLLEFLLAEVDRFADGRPQSDDRTVLVARIS